MARTADYVRKTKETDISLHLNLDGTGSSSIHTGIGFFDHMLDGFARHGLFDLKVNVAGDLAVDCHHTIEDTGIVLGMPLRRPLVTRRESGATEAVFCRWMKHLSCAQWIFPEDLILCSMENLRPTAWDIWIRRW